MTLLADPRQIERADMIETIAGLGRYLPYPVLEMAHRMYGRQEKLVEADSSGQIRPASDPAELRL